MSARGLAVLDWKAKAKEAVTRAATSVVNVLTPTRPKARSRDAADELERHRQINAEGARLRAERGRAFDLLMGRSTYWIFPRTDWMRPRDRRRGW